MRVARMVTIGTASAAMLVGGCEQERRFVDETGDDPAAAAAPARTMSQPVPVCPAEGDTTALPVVTVRGGGAVARGRVMVGDSVFESSEQVIATDPGFARAGTVADSVRLLVGWAPGNSRSQAAPDEEKFEHTIVLPRCTQDEGRLVRVHVDGVDLKAGTPGPPVVSVIGIYDALTSEAALERQAYACVRCGRIEVCGAEPPDC